MLVIAGLAMLMSELVEALSASFPGVARRDVDRAVRAILDRISYCRTTGERVELRQFGVFEVKIHPPRDSRNPRTGGEDPTWREAHVTFQGKFHVDPAHDPELLQRRGTDH